MCAKELKTNRENMRNEPRIVGEVRNEFGTRLCQRIECSRCHKVDYVAKRIAKAKTIYCRDCAERLISTFESGRKLSEKKISSICVKCKIEFSINEEIALKREELQCPDCYRGFEVWRGKLASQAAKESPSLIIRGKSNTILRKAIDDKV
jgi:hypothetical protein